MQKLKKIFDFKKIFGYKTFLVNIKKWHQIVHGTKSSGTKSAGTKSAAPNRRHQIVTYRYYYYAEQGLSLYYPGGVVAGGDDVVPAGGGSASASTFVHTYAITFRFAILSSWFWLDPGSSQPARHRRRRRQKWRTVETRMVETPTHNNHDRRDEKKFIWHQSIRICLPGPGWGLWGHHDY